ncbi:phosphodiesterase [Geminicoccus roseus]|uniref:phosphodiesterase n=1 Tax=Geminicoccus roseus TaxID=404900 RepID=UPI000425A14B|nr:phosphodiesterase [Geminicoccus roseus]
MLICQLTDLHVVPEGTLAYQRVPANQMVARAIDRVLALDPAPDVVVVTGDLTNCGRVEEYRILKDQLARLKQPVFVIPGNHDRRENLRQGLGHLLPRDLDGERLHQVVDDFPVRLVLLDTVVPGHGHGELGEACLDWLEARLADEPRKPTIVAMHHPPFHCGIGHMDRIALFEPGRFAAVIARHPQVERVICGHHHRPIVVRFAGTIASISPSLVHQVELDLGPEADGMFVMEPPAFQLHRWTEATGLVSHTAYVDPAEGPYPFTDEPDYPGKLA